MRVIWQPHTANLSRRIPWYSEQTFTYPEIGATREALPPGYHRVTERTVLGKGKGVFDAAGSALMNWSMHRRAGLAVAASAERVDVGVTAVMAVTLGPLGLVLPCRVVWTEDGPDRCGFAYGTLPGHPERGEESFVVQRDGDVVTLCIIAFSAPGNVAVRLAGPIPRYLQARATTRYQQSLASLSAEPSLLDD
jgi:uncharacterized protein (UPF0548 family)